MILYAHADLIIDAKNPKNILWKTESFQSKKEKNEDFSRYLGEANNDFVLAPDILINYCLSSLNGQSLIWRASIESDFNCFSVRIFFKHNTIENIIFLKSKKVDL